MYINVYKCCMCAAYSVFKCKSKYIEVGVLIICGILGLTVSGEGSALSERNQSSLTKALYMLETLNLVFRISAVQQPFYR